MSFIQVIAKIISDRERVAKNRKSPQEIKEALRNSKTRNGVFFNEGPFERDESDEVDWGPRLKSLEQKLLKLSVKKKGNVLKPDWSKRSDKSYIDETKRASITDIKTKNKLPDPLDLEAKKLNWFDIANWSSQDGWRKEELESAVKALKSLKKIRDAKHLRESYFFRDLCDALLDRYKDVSKIDVKHFAKRIKDTIGFKNENQIAKVLKDSLGRGPTSSTAYITPKSILYTLRGDYDKLIEKSKTA